MALSRTSSKSPQTLYKISLKRDDILENPVFNEGIKNGKIKLLDSIESKIIYESFNEDIILVMNEKGNFFSLKQRIDNECGYYSLISVFFSLIKKKFGKLDSNFLNLFIEKATTLGITKDYKGISGVELEKLINEKFFDSKKVCSYQKGNPLEPRINGMIVKGHWIGQIPQNGGKSILLEPFSGKIFEADDKHLKKIEDDILMFYRKMKGNFKNHDHKIFINKELLFKFYKLFTKDLNLKSNNSSIVLSTIEEGEEGESSRSSRSRSRSRSRSNSRSNSRSSTRSSRSRSRSKSKSRGGGRSRGRGNSSNRGSRSRSRGGGRRKNKRTIRR